MAVAITIAFTTLYSRSGGFWNIQNTWKKPPDEISVCSPVEGSTRMIPPVPPKASASATSRSPFESIAMSEGATNKSPDEITISGNAEDIRAIELMMLGVAWARRGESGLESSEAYETPPELVDDPHLHEHWPTDLVPSTVQYRLFMDEEEHQKQLRLKSGMDFRSIYVSSVTAYAGTDAYAARASLLESAGFICLRSRRDEGGKYWEIWFMPGPCCAKGPMKGKKHEEIVNWLMHSVGPGSISIEGQHWGASIE